MNCLFPSYYILSHLEIFHYFSIMFFSDDTISYIKYSLVSHSVNLRSLCSYLRKCARVVELPSNVCIKLFNFSFIKRQDPSSLFEAFPLALIWLLILLSENCFSKCQHRTRFPVNDDTFPLPSASISLGFLWVFWGVSCPSLHLTVRLCEENLILS